MCMDTCTNVPDMCRKEKQRVQGGEEGRVPPEGDGVWERVSSVSMGLFAVQDTGATGEDRGAADDLHPPAGGERRLISLRTPEIAHKKQQMRVCVCVCVWAISLGTSQNYIRSPFGNNRCGT